MMDQEDLVRNIKRFTSVIILCFVMSGLNAQVSLAEFHQSLKPSLLYTAQDSLDKTYRTGVPNFNINKLPFFCKLEERWTQTAKVNVRLRLGSLDYVNKLESKGTSNPH